MLPRAERRRRRERAICRARRIVKLWLWDDDMAARRMASTHCKPCSCEMCSPYKTRRDGLPPRDRRRSGQSPSYRGRA